MMTVTTESAASTAVGEGRTALADISLLSPDADGTCVDFVFEDVIEDGRMISTDVSLKSTGSTLAETVFEDVFEEGRPISTNVSLKSTGNTPAETVFEDTDATQTKPTLAGTLPA